MNEDPIGSDEVGTFPGAIDYWLILDGSIQPSTAIDSIDIQDTQGGNSTARFKLFNPLVFPRAGQTVQIIWRDETLFGGQLVSVPLDMDRASSVKTFACEAVGWMRILERRLITATYTNSTFQAIAIDVLNNTLSSEGITRGIIDEGPMLSLASGDKMRISEFLRDVAEAAGGIVYIDPYKALHFRTLTLDRAPFILHESDAMDLSTEEDLDQYRNLQKVTVTGTGGASVNVQRSSGTEITSRIALEGGTGIYEEHDNLDHPTSNDTIQLTKLGISYCLIKLAAMARVRRTFKAKIRLPRLRLGQIIEVAADDYQLSGFWQITRLRTWDEGAELRFEFEAQLTNFQQLALESLLKIVGAARATVMLPVANYATLATYASPGTFTFTVPGSGDVELEFTVYGAGSGGGASFVTYGWGAPNNRSGYQTTTGTKGAAGGKAITLRQMPAGTILTLIIGSAGSGGIFDSIPQVPGDPGFAVQPPGTDGGDTQVLQLGLAIGIGYGGSYANGPGIGVGDYMYTGDGSAGGNGGLPSTNGASGNDGYLEIRY